MYLDVYRDGQLLYPNRVAAVRASGDIIVTERSPTHQVQIYNQYGQFVRKFGANILQVRKQEPFTVNSAPVAENICNSKI